MAKISMSDKVALITGAAGGIGKAYALELAARGAAIVVNDLGGDTTGQGSSLELAQKLVDQIRAGGGRAIASADSVSTKAGGEAMVQAAIDAFGRIDIVVNNAGNQRNALFENLTEDDIESVLAVHLKGAFFVTQPAYRLMKQQNYGRIIFTASQSGIFGSPFRANYGSAKTAMIGLMNVIAQEAPASVLVNCVYPVALGSRMGSPGEERVDIDFLKEGAKRSAPLMGLLDPAYVAALLVYLASEECKTSQNMYSVVGGRYARIFVGLTQGWLSSGSTIPSAEDILEHIAAIDDPAGYTTPLCGFDEIDGVVAQRTKAKG